MKAMQALRMRFDEVLIDFEQSVAIKAIAAGTFTVAHYKAVLREIYFYTRENPQIQALAAVYFRGNDRPMVKPFFRHAISEIGHDRMALDDLAALGGDVDGILKEQPLPSTIAMVAYPFYQIQHLNPIGYLGYLFFLEFTPTQAASKYMAYLSRIGVPDNAQTFLQEHVKVDMHHNKWMEEYAETLIRSESDLDSVLYAMRATGALYAAMLEGAMRHATAPGSPVKASLELART
jgi:pyrroloquinoline quinone (PQQ) biosynthesis protein C